MGKRFEILVCRFLTEWWAGESAQKRRADDLPFRRTPCSGGWTRRHTDGHGDIIPEKSQRFPFIIEAKHRKSWSWDQLVEGKNPELEKYWGQAAESSERTKKKSWPMLVFAQRSTKIYVRIPRDMWLGIRKDCPELGKPLVQVREGVYWRWQHFLKTVSPAAVKSYTSKA